MNSTRNTLVLWLMVAACGDPAIAPDPKLKLASALAACPQCPAVAYASSDGFVVHEWGTLTSVMGSDGVLLPGLHHEEEDLPGFVADRVAQVAAYPSSNTFQKMETPVTYFYSPMPQVASVSVSFTNGLLTQWFPWVQRVAPPVFDDSKGVVIDSWLSSSMSLPQSCAEKFTMPFRSAFSSLDWGEVQILGRTERPVLAGPIGDASWRFARNVASNALAVKSPDGATTQHEQFLFYRGLGDFELPVTATVHGRPGAERARFVNTAAAAAGRVLLMQVTNQGAAFVEVGDVGSDPVEALVPTQLQPLPEFVKALKATLMASLVADGLFTDEAKAMVDTWERSYFLTPGLRALYLLPQERTDALIPLSITPAPRVLKRTMVIRLELLAPSAETGLSASLTRLSTPLASGVGRAEFLALGRFAEPHLSRAVALSPVESERAAGEALLKEIRGTRRWAPVTAQ